MPFIPNQGWVIWLTGLSGSGKTTIGRLLESRLRALHLKVELLDGDELRRNISSELGFSKQDRETHARRVAYISNLLSRNGITTIVALISPYREVREYARNTTNNFVEVWVKCSIETCVKRDPKRLYRKAKEGKISLMTGITDPYEEPLDPEIIIDTEGYGPENCAERIIQFMMNNCFIRNPNG